MTNKFEIRYSSEFFEELEAIVFYIKNELKNYIAANKLLAKVETEIEKRKLNPKSYEQYKTIGGYSYYKIYVVNYVIFYTVIEKVMEIRNVKYHKRDFERLI